MKNRTGFTMIEMLFALSIIAIIIALGLVSYSKALIKSRDSTRKTDLESISNALEQYKSHNEFGSYPSSIYKNLEFEKYMTSVPTPYPAGYNPIPVDPQTKKEYFYEPLPAGCEPSFDTSCISYTLETTLEKDSQFYTINPYGEQ
ncbi:MAG: prepilin-type N-terminal cleavage/methylation domain-containing protein [bacterium]